MMAVMLSGLGADDETHEGDLADPAYRAEYDRTRLPNDTAIRVPPYRTEHGLSQTAFECLVSMRQPHVEHLKAAELRTVPGVH